MFLKMYNMDPSKGNADQGRAPQTPTTPHSTGSAQALFTLAAERGLRVKAIEQREAHGGACTYTIHYPEGIKKQEQNKEIKTALFDLRSHFFLLFFYT